jgi:glutamate-5-semialdehyde dehydrogenase
MNNIINAAERSRQASRLLANCQTETKNTVLTNLANRIEQNAHTIINANVRDLTAADQAGITGPKRKRLTLKQDGITQMTAGLRQIAQWPDPVGTITRKYQVPSGLNIQKVRAPIGVIMMIYEARPNVTIDAFSLCFKAGNACILKGGREAIHTNEALANIAHDALKNAGLPTDALLLLTTSDREEIKTLLKQDACIDLVIPRGGTELIRFVHEHSTIPTIQHFHGVCHIYVDESADLEQAVEICTTAKTSAPATCNAAEAILIHQAIADQFVPKLADRLTNENVEIRGDETVCTLTTNAKPAKDDDWGKEFLDLIIAVRVVSDINAAIDHIQTHGSHHTDAILTNDTKNADEFCARVQSSCTLVNASTRFNDGFQLGLGAEIGISTSKIHAFGPMGIEELTIERYIAKGTGQSR